MSIQDTRLAILKSALEAFSHRGFIGAPTKEIASAAGISEMTLFRHFETKQQLFEAVLSTFIFQPSFEKLNADLSGDLNDVLELFATRFIEMLKKNRQIMTIMMQELPRMCGQGDPLDPFRIKLKNILAEQLRHLQARGDFTGSVDTVSITFVTSLMGVFIAIGILNAFAAEVNLDTLVNELIHCFVLAHGG